MKLSGLHIFALSSFALSQPLFDVLARDAGFFVARRSQPVDIWLLTLTLALLVPCALILLEWIVWTVSHDVHRRLHLFLVGVLLTGTLLPPLIRASDLGTNVVLLLACTGGLVGAFAYAQFKPISTFLSILSPAVLLFAGTFLIQPQIRALAFDSGERMGASKIASDTTIVHIVLDELPLASLMDSGLGIDADLFPNFARLARGSTWFRNATASHQSTVSVIPAILTGMLPRPDKPLATATEHPRSLFTFLGGSHRMRVSETITSLLPDELRHEPAPSQPLVSRNLTMLRDVLVVYGHIVMPDPDWLDLPAITDRWGDFVEAGDATATRKKRTATQLFREFLSTIDESAAPTLYFLHVLTPHIPWSMLPSGRRYSSKERIAGWDKGWWSDDWWPAALGYQRHLLQVGHVDALIGELLDKLAEESVYDRCLLVVTADHGCSFRPGQNRREAYAENFRDILHVPLFVKLPFQHEGEIIDRSIESIDILPSIAQALGAGLPWEVDGTSVLSESEPARKNKTLFRTKGLPPLVVESSWPKKWWAVEEKVRLFGADPDWDAIFALSTRPELLGRPCNNLPVASEPFPGRVSIRDVELLEHVDARSGSNYVEGVVIGTGDATMPRELAFSIDDLIQAVVPTYANDERHAKFAVMIPERAFHEGHNHIEVFAVDPGGTLTLIPSPERKPSYRIVRGAGDSEQIVRSDGREYRVVVGNGNINSYIDQAVIEDDALRLAGWAADAKNMHGVDSILVFIEDACVYEDSHSDRRDESAKITFQEGATAWAKLQTGIGAYMRISGLSLPGQPLHRAVERHVRDRFSERVRLSERVRQSGLRFDGRFQCDLPLRLFAGGVAGRTRLFALSHDRACELRYGNTGAWLRP